MVCDLPGVPSRPYEQTKAMSPSSIGCKLSREKRCRLLARSRLTRHWPHLEWPALPSG